MNYIFHKKMKILCFDTETTGLIQRGDFGVKLYPHILQISWMVYDTMEEYITTKYDTYISIPDDVPISEKSIEIHGITRKKCKRYGLPIDMVLKHFYSDVQNVDIIIAHNLSFDKAILEKEYERNNLLDPFRDLLPQQMYCTMRNNIEKCNLPNRKYPKLSELHQYLFPEDNSFIESGMLHDSYMDTILTLRCYLFQEHQIDIREYIQPLIKSENNIKEAV